MACLASSLRRADSHPRAQMLKGDSSVRQPLTSAFRNPFFFLFFAPPQRLDGCINGEDQEKTKARKSDAKSPCLREVPGGKVIWTPRQRYVEEQPTKGLDIPRT
jgi:hypothetical protein